jgi:hypothetical protein
MRYQVIQKNKIIGSFRYFFDAWLYVYLELPCFARIKGPDGIWIVNPHTVN